ncbi:hypothetical protein OROHE_019521 [Orobanche hederae]
MCKNSPSSGSYGVREIDSYMTTVSPHSNIYKNTIDILKQILKANDPEWKRSECSSLNPSLLSVAPISSIAQRQRTIHVTWKMPVQQVKLNSDGYSLKSGSAGSGVVLRDQQGMVLLAKATYLSNMDSLEAEVRSLTIGMEAAYYQGYTEVQVEVDSLIFLKMLRKKIAIPWRLNTWSLSGLIIEFKESRNRYWSSSLLELMRSKARLKLPPSPYAWPIIGNILAVDSQKTHTWLADLTHQYGPFISLKLGPNVLLVASSPAADKEILKTRDRDLSGRFRSRLAASLPELQSPAIVLSSECTKSWRFLGRISHTEVFSLDALQVNAILRAIKAQEMLDFLASKEGEVVEIVNVVYATFVNTLTISLMSRDLIESMDCPVDDLKAFPRELVGFTIPGMADMYSLMGAVLGSGTKNTAMAFREKSREIWDDAVRERRNSGKKMNDFLDVLINSSFEDDHIHYLFSVRVKGDIPRPYGPVISEPRVDDEVNHGVQVFSLPGGYFLVLTRNPLTGANSHTATARI